MIDKQNRGTKPKRLSRKGGPLAVINISMGATFLVVK